MKSLEIAHKPNGTFLQNSVGVVASMEAGYQQTRVQHAMEIKRAVNHYDSLLASLKFLADAAETEPAMNIYRAHIDQAHSVIKQASILD